VDLPGMMDDDGEWFTMGTVDEIFLAHDIFQLL
jgi:hypothetical protein